MQGWISLHRRLAQHELWTSEPFSRGQAWVDLLLLANHKDGFIYVRGNKINIKRGQVGWSEHRLAERWQWSRNKVRKFIKDLEEEQQIKPQKNNVTSVISIVNYDKYQQNEPQKVPQKNRRRTTEGTAEEPQKVPQKDTNNNDNNGNNDNNTYTHTRAERYKPGEGPTLNEVKNHGNMKGIPPDNCKVFFDKMEERNWLRYDKQADRYIPIQNWERMLERYYTQGYINTEKDKLKSLDSAPNQTANQNAYKEFEGYG